MVARMPQEYPCPAHPEDPTAGQSERRRIEDVTGVDDVEGRTRGRQAGHSHDHRGRDLVLRCFTVPTRNITLSVPDDIVRKVKVLAAQRDTSVSAIVTEMLAQLVGTDPSYDDQWAAEVAVMAAGTGMRVGDIAWSRDELHRR